jgi:hypothetical protein
LKQLLKRYPLPRVEEPAKSVTISGLAQFQSVFEKIFRPVPTMPPPLLTFNGSMQFRAAVIYTGTAH